MGEAKADGAGPTRILVVGEDPAAGEPLAGSLATLGHVVVAARDGQEALQALRQDDYMLVITDDAFAASGQPLTVDFKAINPDLLVAMVSAAALTVDEILAAGVDFFVQTPCDIVYLHEVVSAAVTIPQWLEE